MEYIIESGNCSVQLRENLFANEEIKLVPIPSTPNTSASKMRRQRLLLLEKDDGLIFKSKNSEC